MNTTSKRKQFRVTVPQWQVPYRLLFQKEKGMVNVDFSSKCHRKVPSCTKAPRTGDKLFGNYALMVSSTALDVIECDIEIIITPAIGCDTRTLMECWRAAFMDYYSIDEKHHPSLHESWYGWVESY